MILLVKLFESLLSCLFDAKRVHETEVDEEERIRIFCEKRSGKSI